MKPVAIRPAQRCQAIAPFHVMALLARAQALQAQGHDVIHLEVGEPDFPTPAPVVAAGQQALAQGLTRYSPAAGIPALREAIAHWYQQRFGVTVSPERILVTPGASGALQLVLAALVNPGDGVLLTDPGYPCNRHFLELVNGVAQPINLCATGIQAVTASQIDAAWQPNTVAALLASPDNPTGAVLSPEALAEIASVVRARNGALIMDEIYQGLVYDQPAYSVLAEDDNAIVINSFSKYFGMTGWRLGWLVAPQALMPDLDRMAQNFFLAAPTVAQHAALAAFQPDTVAELERRRDELKQRRDYLLKALPELGLNVVAEPAGAFYLYLDVSAITDDSYDWCLRLLEQEKLALTPGRDFGVVHPTEKFVRIAYTTGLDRLAEAVERLQRFIRAA